ncbi:MAG: putative DNA helicase ino80 [Claussenomyces sp. TS43310]|nr:MAG: putative DNA helicase ino80 [Claussenomyces sp. TS43310]
MQRPQEDDEDRLRRERMNEGTQNFRTQSARSPTQTNFQPPYSPTQGVHPRPIFNSQYHPPTPAPLPLPTPSHIAAHPSSPLSATAAGSYPTDYQGAPRDKPTSNYYDPTSDSSERRPTEGAGWYNGHKQTPQNREVYSYPSTTGESSKFQNGTYTSPVTSTFGAPRSPVSHSHPTNRVDSRSQSPGMATLSSPTIRQVNGLGPSSGYSESIASPSKVNRPADPMSFSSILTSAEPAPEPTPTPVVIKEPRRLSRPAIPVAPIDEAISRNGSRRSSANVAASIPTRVPAKRQANGQMKARQRTAEQEKEIQLLMAQIDAEASDFENPEFEHERALFRSRNLKRRLELETQEASRRKLRRTKYVGDAAASFGRHATAGEQRYRDIHAEEAIASVQEKEVQAEKERKKDMQRKRRREKTVATNLEQKEAALAKAQQAADESERKKFIREAERAEKKALQTKLILARGDKGPEIRTVSPIEPNFHGGTMTTFAAEPENPKAKGKGSGRGGARLRKSKEQKQAEKDSAEAAQAAIDAGEEPAQLPAHEPRIKIKLGLKESKEARDESPVVVEPFKSKSYNQVYDQIWKDIAKKDVPKVAKLAADTYTIKASNLKKTAILASKEAKRWQLRTNKGTKDLQARAKRIMREMMTFWKRNEREERDLRKAAERAEIENAKKAEADREANRQKRKLNFLISQTELYSHFVGKKIKTDEVERSTDHPDVASTDVKITPGLPNGHTINLPSSGVAPAKVTSFDELDFDAEDESTLQAAAAANAQNAIREAQTKARAFNNQGPAMDEEGELNFQNPAGMGDVDIEQPKMLTTQLKEYQLKGLNWLVNLYEQGINGILADEMGLGKTVQSISVMAYLAEKHDIWGPFLVVAPASTLHNWQQEITKFVPSMKVLPYWGTAADRKVLRKFWDRKHITYTQDSPFHVLVTSYQLVVSDVAYFQKMKWQYMILDEAQAIKSSQSSRWKSLLGFHCRNRLLLTGTPIQNNMQELWALLHFIMPSLFDSHDEFSEWFSKDIESHAQSNTKLNEDQLRRLHMILKPFMLRRVKKHVQKELGDKIEEDIFCDLTYRQRAYYSNLRNQISIMDLIEKATLGDDNDSGTLMNLVMQFRKVCNHPDLFERAETTSPFSFAYFAETGSFLREGQNINVAYSTRNLIEYNLPRLVWRDGGRLDLPGRNNERAGFKKKWVDQEFSIWKPTNTRGNRSFSWLRLAGSTVSDLETVSRTDAFARAIGLARQPQNHARFGTMYGDDYTPAEAMLRIVDRKDHKSSAEVTNEGVLAHLLNVSKNAFAESGISRMGQCGRAAASAPPIEVVCSSRGAVAEKESVFFNMPIRRALYGPSEVDEKALIEAKVPISSYPPTKMLPEPTSEKQRFTDIVVPSMRRFVTDSGKLAKLDELLFKLKEGGHRVLLYFQMTRMIDLMEEYLTYRNYKYLRLDGSTKLEDRRDTVHDFQTRPEIFIFLLSTRAGGLGINLTSADTVIFYDSDWNPTIDSQAMDRAHRLGQTRQVTVYRMITRGTIEERIRKRALQKEEVQKVVMTGGAGGGVDFNTRSKENRTKDIAMWLADDDQAAEIERKEAELAAQEAKEGDKGGRKKGKKRKVEERSLEELYHEGEGHFDDGSNKPSGTVTPVTVEPAKKKKKITGKKAKTTKQRLAMADGDVDMDMEM